MILCNVPRAKNNKRGAKKSMEIEKIHTSTALLSGFCILVIDVPSAALTTAVITPPETNK